MYAPFDLQAGSDGFNTGFAFPEVLTGMVEAARAMDWQRVHDPYARFAAQQPGVAIRKDILRRATRLHVRERALQDAPVPFSDNQVKLIGVSP